MSSSRKSRTTAFLESVGLKERDPQEMLKEWRREIRKAQRGLDRQIREIEREEAKMKKDIKMLAKKGETDAVRPLAKSIVEAKAAKSRILVAKAHMNSIILELRHQVAQVKMAKVMEGSTKLMKSVNKVQQLQLPELQKVAVEMERAGLIQEMVDDTLEDVFDDGLETEVEDEVDKVISELTLGILNEAPSVPVASPRPAREELAESGKGLFQQAMSGGPEPVLAGSGGGGGQDFDRRLAALQD